MSHLTYAEAMVIGLIQGVTELFPVSSLGHSVLIPALVGGSWAQDLSVSRPESPYLAFIVGLHVATAAAMIIYFRHDWARIITGFVSSLRDRTIAAPEQKLAWIIVLATIPVGLSGLALEHVFRVVFSKPVPTALFLTLNGVILLAGERARRRSGEPGTARQPAMAAQTTTPQHAMTAAGYPAQPPGRYPASPLDGLRQQSVQQPAVSLQTVADRRLATMGYGKAIVIGAVQVFALLPGISRDGIVTVTGMFRGLSREDAVRYSFLLSAPVILAAGVLKIPDLFGPLGAGIHGQVLVGSLLSGLGAYFSVRFLVRYFSKARSLAPFAIYCLIAGLGSLAWFAIR
jgi:undecaprenyl-diphosphatase